MDFLGWPGMAAVKVSLVPAHCHGQNSFWTVVYCHCTSSSFFDLAVIAPMIHLLPFALVEISVVASQPHDPLAPLIRRLP